MTLTKTARESHIICVVDDDKAVRDALSNLLESVGLKVEAFASAEEFVSSSPVKNRSCMILDVRLPGMGGLELQQHLSNKPDSVPIIFITGHANEEARSQALNQGAVSFLTKPFSSEDLLSAILSTFK